MDEDNACTQVARKGGLVHLKSTYRYRNQFRELDDDCLDAIEATSNEMLGNFSKKSHHCDTCTRLPNNFTPNTSGMMHAGENFQPHGVALVLASLSREEPVSG